MAEKKKEEKVPVEKTYYCVGKINCGLSIPVVNEQGKPVYKKINGEFVYSGGAKVLQTRIIRFTEEQIHVIENEPTRCTYSTSDPYEIDHLDKLCKLSGNDIISKRDYDKKSKPVEFKLREENKSLRAELEKLKGNK